MAIPSIILDRLDNIEERLDAIERRDQLLVAGTAGAFVAAVLPRFDELPTDEQDAVVAAFTAHARSRS